MSRRRTVTKKSSHHDAVHGDNVVNATSSSTVAVAYLGTTQVSTMRSCGPRPGLAIVHATPAAITRNATLPRTNATSGDTRGAPNIGTPTQAIHASAGDQATRNRIVDRVRPISRLSRLTTACPSARVT